MSPSIIPPPLNTGDAVAIISPAGQVEEVHLENTLRLIKQKGYFPVLSPHALGKYEEGYLYSGTEEERAQDLQWALSDPNISAIWASRGGYGCQHLIQQIELSSFIQKPKWFIGYSDNTVIQSFLLKHGYASLHGQTIKTPEHGVTAESYSGVFSILEGQLPHYSLESHPLNRKGQAEGPLVGGNLALIYALLGTPYSFSFQNTILFIEEIGESYYALDRMLMSLDLAGVFNKIKGLIIGGMTQMGGENASNPSENFDEKAYKIIMKRIQNYHFPVLLGFPNGHLQDNRPLIIGAKVHLEVDKESKVMFSS